MNSMINGTRFLAAAVLGAALFGCDSIRDVREEPYTELPAATVVLEGKITGLGSRRSLVLMNNGDATRAVSFLAAAPTAPVSGPTTTHFSFGAVPVGSPYNIEVRTQPVGKTCTVSNGSGTITTSDALNITIDCQNSLPRYSMTVNAAAIAGLAGAKVTLTTEEAVYEAPVPAGTTTVTFTDALFNPGVTPVFIWNLQASTTEQGTQNKCPIVDPTNTTSPTGNLTRTVSPCFFTIGGSVAYSLPPSGGATPGNPSGLVLELRTTGEDVVRQQAYSGAWGGTFTFNNDSDTAPHPFVSNRSAVYYVAVAEQPLGMHCVVVNPTAILYAPQLTQNPTSITGASAPAVQCRNLPAVGNQLRGVYRHVGTTWQRRSTTPVQQVTWNAFDFTKQNTASSNMIAFFENGTYIYGTHANVTQIEHGFYEYTPGSGGTGTIGFTLNIDTTVAGATANQFPGNFNPANATSAGAVPTTTNGLNAVPGATGTGPARQAVMINVDTDTAGRITGRFTGSQSVSATPANLTNDGVAIAASTEPLTGQPPPVMDWVLEAPYSVPNQMSGGWLAQDARRLWVYDARTYYGTHVGVLGVMAMNDACFTLQDITASSSFYTRRPSIIGCYPWPRAATNQSPAFTLGGVVESIDSITPQFIGAAGVANRVDIGLLPEFMSRLPGGRQAADGRSPSPIYFHIAPAAQFYAEAPGEYFPVAPTDWCTSEILGIRSTLNGIAIHKPVYFCRWTP